MVSISLSKIILRSFMPNWIMTISNGECEYKHGKIYDIPLLPSMSGYSTLVVLPFNPSSIT